MSPVVWSVPGRHDRVAITFDDGPTAWTPQVLDVLKAGNIRATFFVLGRAVEQRSEMVQRMLAEGHEIAIHGYDHTVVAFSEQIRRCLAALRPFGVAPRLVRPPGGRIRPGFLLWCWMRRRRIVLFNFDTRDSMRHEGKFNGGAPDYSCVMGGDIILMHDDNPVCLAELTVLLKALKEMNVAPVTVSELMSCD